MQSPLQEGQTRCCRTFPKLLRQQALDIGECCPRAPEGSETSQLWGRKVPVPRLPSTARDRVCHGGRSQRACRHPQAGSPGLPGPLLIWLLLWSLPSRSQLSLRAPPPPGSALLRVFPLGWNPDLSASLKAWASCSFPRGRAAGRARAGTPAPAVPGAGAFPEPQGPPAR